MNDFRRHPKRVFYRGPDGHTHWVSSNDPQIVVFMYNQPLGLMFRRKDSDWNITIPREQILRVDEKVL